MAGWLISRCRRDLFFGVFGLTLTTGDKDKAPVYYQQTKYLPYRHLRNLHISCDALWFNRFNLGKCSRTLWKWLLLYPSKVQSLHSNVHITMLEVLNQMVNCGFPNSGFFQMKLMIYRKSTNPLPINGLFPQLFFSPWMMGTPRCSSGSKTKKR